MNWREIYASKLKTPQEAVKIIHSGDTVLIGHAAAEPDCLVNAMVDYAVEQDLRRYILSSSMIWGPVNFLSLGWRGILNTHPSS